MSSVSGELAASAPIARIGGRAACLLVREGFVLAFLAVARLTVRGR
jgi:hypothetical protein